MSLNMLPISYYLIPAAPMPVYYNNVVGLNNFNQANTVYPRQNLFNDHDELVIRTPKEGLIKRNSFLHPNLEARNNQFGEKEVFATGPIKEGEIVCIFVGDILNKTEVDKLPKELQCKTLQLAPELYQIASKDPNNNQAFDAAEYFNHSCDPNLVLVGNNVLVAKRDISSGEPLRYDYGTSDTQGNPDTEAGWKCTCGTAKCRGGNDPNAYLQIIKDFTQQYGSPRKAIDLVGHYIKVKYLEQNSNNTAV